jgi:hypothetical protein
MNNVPDIVCGVLALHAGRNPRTVRAWHRTDFCDGSIELPVVALPMPLPSTTQPPPTPRAQVRTWMLRLPHPVRHDVR